jgi:hypothetical protein
MHHFTSLFVFFLTIVNVCAQVYVPISNQPQGRMHAAATWIDLQANGKADLILSGDYVSGNATSIRTTYYQQTGTNRFTAANKGLPDMYNGSMDVGDFNRDGLQDVVLSGMGSGNRPVSGIYLGQKDGSFKKTNANFTALTEGSVEFGDFDKDGFLDLLISGKDQSGRPLTIIYRNDQGQLADINARLPGISNGKASWGDANSNGQLDVLLCGNSTSGPITQIYTNTNGQFRMLTQRFPGLKNSSASWADFDQDGAKDFIISGETSSGMPLTRIYRNMGNSNFAEVPTPGIRPLKSCSIDVGDFDTDGDLDIVMTGESLERPYTIVYENKGNFNFVDIIGGLPGVSAGVATFGDYDGDGDLDLFVSGLDVCFEFVGLIFRNTIDPKIEQEETMDIFIESPIVDYSKGPYYYFVWSSCFCDLQGGDNKSYNMFVSNIHKERQDFNLNYKFNELLINRFPNWGFADRGHRTSNAFLSIPDAEVSRQQIIDSYRADGFQIHFFNW